MTSTNRFERDLEPLGGLVAAVTGSAKGIEATIAETLHRAGASVALIDQNDSFDLSRFEDDPDRTVTTWVADLMVEDDVTGAFGGIIDHHGRIDILVNNAGVALGLERKPFWELTTEEWDFAMAVNARSAFFCGRSAVPAMMNSANGRIVNIASDAVASGVPNWIHYVASKAAVVGITRAMAADLGSSRITVNVIAPGLTSTANVASRLSRSTGSRSHQPRWFRIRYSKMTSPRRCSTCAVRPPAWSPVKRSWSTVVGPSPDCNDPDSHRDRSAIPLAGPLDCVGAGSLG